MGIILSVVCGVLISRFCYQVLILSILYLFYDFMCKLHATDIFAAFYIRETILIANITKTQ